VVASTLTFMYLKKSPGAQISPYKACDLLLGASSLLVQTGPAEDEPLPVTLVTERSGEVRLVSGDACLCGRYAFATVYTGVVGLVDSRCFTSHTTTIEPHPNKS